MDVNQTYCSDHFPVYTYIESLCYTPKTNTMLYVSYPSIKKIITLYTLKLHGVICQIYLNKARRKKRTYISKSLPATLPLSHCVLSLCILPEGLSIHKCI